MAIYKTESNNTWYVMVRYQDWTGERKQKCKRGFATKRGSAGADFAETLGNLSDQQR